MLMSELYYTDSGETHLEALIMLHGNGENGEIFRNQAEHYSGRYRVILPDTRGHGRSPEGNGDFSLTVFAKDLYGLMCELGLKSAHILGFSDGANIAMLFAIEHPEMCRSLILNSGNLYPFGLRPLTRWSVRIGFALTSLLSPVSERAQKKAKLLRLMSHEPHIDPQSLSVIKCPVLVIAGKFDVIKSNHTKMIASHIENCTLVFINGFHNAVYTNPGDFNSEADKFLRGI